jgi:S-adenosylmethionine:tRNA ribosyltransferase-isomerase
LGVKLIQNPVAGLANISLSQWEVYDLPDNVSVTQSLNAIIGYLNERNLKYLNASTSILIVPGYVFRLTDGMITNFHQPRSTLLLLISAWTGNHWKEIYKFALENRFRFLSYGDSSLLLK